MDLRRWFSGHFGAVEPAGPDHIQARLWNSEILPSHYSTPGGEKYQAAIMDQYKIYVEMADRISARRALANTFFLTLNASVITLIGIFWKDRPVAPAYYLAVPLSVLLGLCFAWFWIVRAYRQLNSGKYVVIGALERRLPASPYWAAEWEVLGRGRDKSLYWPLTHVEKWVPLLFAVAYGCAFVYVLIL